MNGITLVALVITIVVLLILAGITILYLMEDNSVFKKASDAKVQMELGKIEERANLIYIDKLVQNVPASLKNKPTMQSIVNQLKTEGYPIEQIATNGSIITGISLDKESMTLGYGSTGEIKATIDMGSGINYYAEVSGKYYKMNYNNGHIIIERTESEISNEGEMTIPTLTVTSGNEDIAAVTIDATTNIITVTAKDGGTTTITVSLKDGSQSVICTIIVTPPKLADIVDKIQDTNREIEDENGNQITIPEGFKVVADTEENDVDYTYSGDKKPTVQDGVVVEDEEGNQFVWIPVGEIKNKDGTTTITLGRYIFADDGTPTLQQNADSYTEAVTIQSYFQELESSTKGNTVAKDLGDFVTKTKANRGYYLARYEASEGSDNKVKSKPSATVWHSVTQPEAATAAREMYISNSFESDLVNSFAWDTAIVFIQIYSGDSDYSKQNSKYKTQTLTGTNGDKVCNIHDMASNTLEYTTETSIRTVQPVSGRGGRYSNISDYTARRNRLYLNVTGQDFSFRSLLYLSGTES